MAHLEIPEKSEKIIADVFEAYIGGVITSNPNGRALVEQFISYLVRPTLEQHKATAARTAKIDLQAASRLNLFAGQTGRKVQFTFVEAGPMGAVDRWEAICLLDMVEAGRAKGRNQQEAKQRVASHVLEALQQC